jgi:hypothetical protein
VEGGKVVSFGAFRLPFRDMNLDEAVFMPRVAGLSPPSRLRLKEWQHYAVIHPRHYIGMVIFDAKFMGLSFLYHLHRPSGRVTEHRRQGLPGSAVVARSVWDGECFFRAKGYRLEVQNRLSEGFHLVTVDIPSRRGRPGVKGSFRMLEDPTRFEPLVVLNPFAPHRPLYTHKNACPVEGRLEIDGEKVDLDPSRDICLLDEHKAFYPYRSFWKWATCAGYTEDGRLVAVNLCQNVIADDEEYNENCVWLDGRVRLLGAARFGFHELDLLSPWFIRTTDGKVDLLFRPQGERAQRIRIGPVMSDFHQPFGSFSGTVKPGDAEGIELQGFFGLCEYHVTRY